jgi:hypothetical protein
MPQARIHELSVLNCSLSRNPTGDTIVLLPGRVVSYSPRPRAKFGVCGFTVPMLKAFIHYGPPICPKDRVEMTAVGDWGE